MAGQTKPGSQMANQYNPANRKASQTQPGRPRTNQTLHRGHQKMAPLAAEVRRGHLAKLQPRESRTCQMTGTTPSLYRGHQKMAPFAAELGGGHMAGLQYIANMVNIEEGSKMFTRMRCNRCSETEAYVSNSKIKLLHTSLNFNTQVWIYDNLQKSRPPNLILNGLYQIFNGLF